MSKYGGIPVKQSKYGGTPIARAAAAAQEEDLYQGITESELERAKLGEQFAEPTRVNDYELDDPSLRFKLSRVESAQDAVTLLQKNLPEDAVAVALQDPNGGRVLGFMREGKDGKNEFFKIDSPTEFSLSDVADFGNLASIETVASVASAFSPAKKMTARALHEFIAAFAGKSLDEVVDQMTGLENQSVDDVLAESTEAGIINAAGGRVADAGSALGNFLRGRGFRTGEGDEITMLRQEAMDAGVRQGLRSAPTQGGLGQRATAISERLGSGIPGRRGVEGVTQDRRAGVADRLKDEAFDSNDEGVLEMEIANLGDQGLLDLVNQAKRAADDEALAGMGVRATSREQGGQALFRGVEEFSERSRVVSDNAYDDYFDIIEQSGAAYNVSPIIRQAQDALKTFRLERVDGGDVNFGQGLDSEFRKLAQDIAALKQVQDRDPLEVTQALRTIRTRLLDLSEKAPGAGTKTNSQRLATKMLSTLHEEVLTNPQGVGIEGAKEAFERANTIWADRSKVLNAMTFARAAKGEVGDGEKLFNALTGDMTEELAKTARANLPKEEFEAFRAAFITDLMSTPRDIPARLQRMGRASEILVPKNFRDTLEVYRRNMESIDTGILSELFAKQASDAKTVSEVIERGTPQDLANLVSQKVIDKGDLRKLIFQDTLERTTTFADGRLQINPLEFTSTVEKLKGGKFWAMLSPEQRAMLNDLEVYTSFIKATDSGSSIAAAEIAASQLQPLTNPAAALSARAKQVQIGIAAEIANSDRMAKILAGRGDLAEPMKRLRASILFTIQAINKAREAESAKDLPEDYR